MKTSNLEFHLTHEHLRSPKIKLPIIYILRRGWQRLIESFLGSNELQVWQTYDQFGNHWWHAYDPATGRHTSVVSEQELRTWIEKRYYS